MPLPPTFRFSQSSLQDYLDCPQRFLLRHMQHRQWPALEAEPVLEHERYLIQGSHFHRMVHQHLLGIPAGRLACLVHDADLEQWWQNYLAYISRPQTHGSPPPLDGRCYPEAALVAPLGPYSLVARYDLLLFSPGHRLLIFDWKTSRRLPRPEDIRRQMQTRVYPYLLASAGTGLNGGQRIDPDQIEMIYWFAGFPEQPVRLPYSQSQFQADQEALCALVEEISRLEEQDFTPTPSHQRCRFCVYRSLCDRGVQAGSLEEMDGLTKPEPQPGLDFDQVAEIAFG